MATHINSDLLNIMDVNVIKRGFSKIFNVKDVIPNTQDYGTFLFKGVIAAPYLERQGLPVDTLENGAWATNGNADKVAAAVLEWAIEKGASSYCHWFQPLASSGLRHGQAGQVQIKLYEFDRSGNLVYDFKGKNLLKGETDGSSYANGGLRATHSAGGYLSVDTSSPIFIRGDVMFIPAAFVSYKGAALDEKTPLLRASDALSFQGVRLLRLLGYNVHKVQANIGLEQEYFFVPRDAYLGRTDLQLAGRTVLGKFPARGQELSDHYMAPPSLASPAMAAIQEIQEECFKLGIPLKTRHREVAPNQYEFAPLFGTVTTQTDQNLIVMQIMEEVAIKHGLTALLQEKPFQGVNGSGKHNNWSLGTEDGTNLFNVGQLAERSGNPDIFPIIIAAIVKAVDQYGDLMRLAIATPGNDFRLGACEAPPAIISVYLGTDMTNYLDAYRKGLNEPYNPVVRTVSFGASAVPPITVPSEDRNRTSPFPFGGHRFEFRAVGSSQNVSLVNTVLSSISAKAFKDFADAIQAGQSPKEVAKAALNTHWKVIFNGNGYDPANQQMLTENGLWRIDSGVEAITGYTKPKNVALFEELGVLTSEECAARQTVLLNHYIGTVEIEALSMVEMINGHIIPSVKAAGVGPLKDLEDAVATLRSALTDIHHTESAIEKARKARVLRLETMINIRVVTDVAEDVVPAKLWTVPTYKDLLFLDQTTKH